MLAQQNITVTTFHFLASHCSLATWMPPAPAQDYLEVGQYLSDHGTAGTAPTKQKRFGVHKIGHKSPLHPGLQWCHCSPHGGLNGGPTRVLRRDARRHRDWRCYLLPSAYRVAGGGKPRKLQASHGSRNTLPKYYSAPGVSCPSPRCSGLRRWGAAMPWGRKPLPSPPAHPALSSDIGPSQGAYRSNRQWPPHYPGDI